MVGSLIKKDIAWEFSPKRAMMNSSAHSGDTRMSIVPKYYEVTFNGPFALLFREGIWHSCVFSMRAL